MPIWNPWHGCTKYSAGCQNCYVYRIDATHGHNSTTVQKTAAFALPMQKRHAENTADGRTRLHLSISIHAP